jgi:transposase
LLPGGKARIAVRRKNEGGFSLFDFFKSKTKAMIVKQVIGVDVAQKELVVCLGRMFNDWKPELYAHKVFHNTEKGIESLMEWGKKMTDKIVPVRYVMEATGVYHQKLAYTLYQKGSEVTIVLPNKISNYARTLDIKTITDKTSSEAIARFGLERTLDLWKKPKDVYKRLQQLTRERDQLITERTVLKNQLHAELAEAEPYKKSVERIRRRIALSDKQEREIMAELKSMIENEPEIQQIILLLCTIPGVGILTAATVLAETNGFELIRNKRQLTSYAGLDVREKQSGTSVKGKPRISKKGNKYLRKAMHLPALSVIRHQENYRAIFARLVSKHGIKMKAAVAIQRKLLELIFTIFKTQKPFDKNFMVQGERKEREREEILGGEHQ